MGSSPLEAQKPALAKLHAEQLDLCDIGVISGALSHELRNVINNVSLQVAVLKKKLPENFHAGLAVIDEQSADAAAILRELQQYRQHRQRQLYLLELNRLIGEEFGPDSQAGSFLLELAGNLPLVLGTRMEMIVLLHLLVDNARQLVPGAKNVLVQTSFVGERVRLQITAQGRSPRPDLWQELFEPPGREKTVAQLELAGCLQIVHRLEGTLRGEDLPAGGLIFIVELPKAEQAK
jgi:signal transduction histidine kinase